MDWITVDNRAGEMIDMVEIRTEEWKLPFITEHAKESCGECNLVDCNIALWRETFLKLESEIPTDLTEDQFTGWKDFLRWLREELLPHVQRESRKWTPVSINDNLAKLHKEVTQEMLTELKTSLIRDCKYGIREVETRLERINNVRKSISKEELNRLLNSVSQHQKWQKKAIEGEIMTPGLVIQFIEQWNRLNETFDDFYRKAAESLLPEDSYYPVVIDFTEILSTRFTTVANLVEPRSDPFLIATRFESAALFLRTYMKKLKEEFIQPLVLSLKDTAYNDILKRVLTCFEKQEDNVQGFVGECMARAESIRQDLEYCSDLDKEEKYAAVANPKARALLNDVLEELCTSTRKYFLKMYVQVLENMDNRVTALKEANVGNVFGRELMKRRAAQVFWKRFLTKAMIDISNGVAITFVTNLKANDDYFKVDVSPTVGFIRKLWNAFKQQIFM